MPGRLQSPVAAVWLMAAAVGSSACARQPAGHAITLDHASFVEVLGPEQADRLRTALARVLREHPQDFPQPPPVDILLRAVPRGAQDDLMNSISYGGVHLDGSRAVVEVHPAAIAGRLALNGAELRSLIGHELVHGYQCTRGPCDGDQCELWRREAEAYGWELSNMEDEVRPEYREDTERNLAMFRAMLEHQPRCGEGP